ncbi:type I glyceraldehyde-3-phosphate dehydrogenase [Candidatus Pacearchaeota archaeon CG10_big_fil_rev_8_21_14_0_10_32_14]|nr:MAG: type I glyceraldehyde-3-phosphate dehydrogenase [Candidatus Pacearchaeota archaeon CG10_big_fil_rev_8_21_14_0_10_32_14]
MTLKVAINGFGRIGRIFLRATLSRNAKSQNYDIVVINHPHGAENAAYLFKHDTAFGLYKGKVEADAKKSQLIIDGKRIDIISERDITKLPWKKYGIDIVLESTGAFTKKKDASLHLTSGAKRVLISAPSDDSDATIVLGVNPQALKPEHKVISLGSCTTNCLAPVIKVLNDNFVIKKAFYNTIHAYTNDQTLHDDHHRKLRRGRAAGLNIVPTSSGASISVIQAIPEMKGKLEGLAIRVPVICGSVTDITAELEKNFEIADINKVIQKASQSSMKGILEFSTDELVSSDIIGNPNSSIYDSLSTMKSGNLVKILSWYDNEYGYSNRLVDFLNMMGKK